MYLSRGTDGYRLRYIGRYLNFGGFNFPIFCLAYKWCVVWTSLLFSFSVCCVLSTSFLDIPYAGVPMVSAIVPMW